MKLKSLTSNYECTVCHIVKEPEHFRLRHKQGRKYLYSQCKECEQAAARAFELELKAYIQSRKTGVPCSDCGRLYPLSTMEYDHREGTTKLGNVSQLINTTRQKIDEEIAKCDLRCANCHRNQTMARLGKLKLIVDTSPFQVVTDIDLVY